MISITMALILAANLLIGVCIGLTGIAGFLLPMFYTGFLGMPAAISLALSFSAFFTSGVLGSVNYHRSGNLNLRIALILSAGSFIGAILGVRLNLLIPEQIMKIILYLVVLFSGLSILIRGRKKTPSTRETSPQSATIRLNTPQYIALGIVTGAICAASGAGGPVLVMPLLTSFGFPAHMAVGISLFDSIFIALPAAAGYLSAVAGEASVFTSLPAILVLHGIGVLLGSRYAIRINQELLKRIVAVASVGIACVKLLGF